MPYLSEKFSGSILNTIEGEETEAERRKEGGRYKDRYQHEDGSGPGEWVSASVPNDVVSSTRSSTLGSRKENTA